MSLHVSWAWYYRQRRRFKTLFKRALQTIALNTLDAYVCLAGPDGIATIPRAIVAAEGGNHVSTVSSFSRLAVEAGVIIVHQGELTRLPDGTFWRAPNRIEWVEKPTDVAIDIERRRHGKTQTFEVKAYGEAGEGHDEVRLYREPEAHGADGWGAQGEAALGVCAASVRPGDLRGARRASHAPLTRAPHKVSRGDSLADAVARARGATEDRHATDNALVTHVEDSPTLDYLRMVKAVDTCPDELDALPWGEPVTSMQSRATRQHFAKVDNEWAFAWTEEQHAEAFENAVNDVLERRDLTPEEQARALDAIRHVECNADEVMRACCNAEMSPAQTGELAREWLVGAVLDPPPSIGLSSSGEHSYRRLCRYIGERARRAALRAQARARERELARARARDAPS